MDKLLFKLLKNPINITVDENKADKYGRVFYSFYNVNLTSLKMKVQRIDPDTQQIKELVVNANVSFWINNGSGNKYIGYELTDGSGIAQFQWKNFTSPEKGNLTFAITWYDQKLNISCEEDLAEENLTYITLYYYEEAFIIVNLTSYKFANYSCRIYS